MHIIEIMPHYNMDEMSGSCVYECTNKEKPSLKQKVVF